MINISLLRIVHIANHIEKANGHVCAMIDLACTQALLGHEVYVCSGGGDFEDLLQAHGITHIPIEQNRDVVSLLKALTRMMATFRRIKPNIVHAHMMTSAVLVAFLRPFMGFKLVTTVHNEFKKSSILMGLGQRVIAVSDAVRISMIKRGIPAKRIRTVLNGTLGSPRFSGSAIPIDRLNHPAITFVGGLHPRKGVGDLIRAHAVVVKSITSAHLYIVGSGPHQQEYTDLAESVAPGTVTFCGHSDDPRSYLLNTDIFTLPSHAEPAALVISEAREAGCAIVATNVGGIPELLEGGKAGLLVPPQRPDLLAEALLRLLTEPDYLTEMRARSQINIEKLSLSRVTSQTLSIYMEVL